MNDRALMDAPLGEDAVLILPHTALASDALVEKLAGCKARIFAGPHTALLNAHGHLHASHMPASLREKWHVDFGLWRDIGKPPSAADLPTLSGFRELLPLGGSEVQQRLGDGTPWSVAGAATMCFASTSARFIHVRRRNSGPRCWRRAGCESVS